MDDEKIITGFCRQLDQSRMVTVELRDGKPETVDCGFGGCIYRPNCTVAREIDGLTRP